MNNLSLSRLDTKREQGDAKNYKFLFVFALPWRRKEFLNIFKERNKQRAWRKHQQQYNSRSKLTKEIFINIFFCLSFYSVSFLFLSLIRHRDIKSLFQLVARAWGYASNNRNYFYALFSTVRKDETCRSCASEMLTSKNKTFACRSSDETISRLSNELYIVSRHC